VACADGSGYTSAVVILAGGSRPKRLNVPGEESLMGKGVFTCAFCDGGQFANKVVAVAGGGDSGVTEAIYMAKIASQVILIEAMPKLTATALLQDRISKNAKISIRCATKVKAVHGNGKVEGVEIERAKGSTEVLKVDGLLVQIGLDAATDYLKDVIELDNRGMIVVNGKLETNVAGILAAGDIRGNSAGQVATAVGDGTTAAMSAIKLLQARE
jgi:thioredoxin reductase (NADPH)